MNKDIISFEYFEEMTTNWNRIDLLRRCYDLCNEMVEKKQEIERLNNIIKEVREYITYWHYRNDFRINSFTTGVKEELLEILDKENK